MNTLNAAPFWETCTLGFGILAGLLWRRRTGWCCGGIITPGLLALHAASPLTGLAALLMGLALAPLLALLNRALGLYGRERMEAAMLLALAARLLILPFSPGLPGIGWVIPGLVAADVERQGAPMTLCGAVSCAIVAAFAVGLLRGVA